MARRVSGFDPADTLDAARRIDQPVSLAEAARMYRMSPHTLRAAIKAGDLRAQRVGTRRYSIYPSDIDAWIRGKCVESARDRARRTVAEMGT